MTPSDTLTRAGSQEQDATRGLSRTASEDPGDAAAGGTSLSPGQLRLVLDWSLLHEPDKLADASGKVRQAMAAGDDESSSLLLQAFLQDMTAKYPSYADLLRFLAIATPGLMECELIGLIKARVAASQFDSHRFLRFRAEMVDRRVIIFLGGIVDFASAGLREAAHRSLFSDNKQRHAYIKVMLEWLLRRSTRSPRRFALLGQLCKDMLLNKLTWIPDRNAKSLMLFQGVTSGEKSTKPKLWGHAQDWLRHLSDLLEHPACIATAGVSTVTSRQYTELQQLGRQLEVSTNKKIQLTRNKHKERVQQGLVGLASSSGAEPDDAEEGREQQPPTLRSAAVFRGVLSSFFTDNLRDYYRRFFPGVELVCTIVFT